MIVLRDELTKLFYKTYNKQLLDGTQTRGLWFVTTGFVKIQEPVCPLFKMLKHAYIRHLALKTINLLLPTLFSQVSFDLRLWSVLYIFLKMFRHYNFIYKLFLIGLKVCRSKFAIKNVRS